MTPEQLKELKDELGTQVHDKIKTVQTDLQSTLDKTAEDLKKGIVTQADFNTKMEEVTKQWQSALSELEKIKQASQEQGDKINAVLENKNGKPAKSIDEFIKLQIPALKKLKSAGVGIIEVTGKELKDAGITSIGGTIDPASPYLPGIGGTPLEIFDMVRNPNFIINRVNMGTTNQSLLAWVNETGYEGRPNADIAESGYKPLIQHKFSLETSKAKKAAAYMILTQEFDQDVPELSNNVRTILQADVLREFDDQLQVQVLAAAKTFDLAGMYDDIQDANYWDAMLALMTQVGYHNFQPNTNAMNWITYAKMVAAKNGNGTYLLPPFKDDITSLLVKTNKFDTNTALSGDLKQYQVRMYEDYVLRMGWINDQFIKNEFAILGELRYHSYISDNRKYALAKGDLNTIVTLIDGTPGS